MSHARRFRVAYTLVALSIFVIGLVMSFNAAKLEPLLLQPHWLAANFLIGTPIAIGLNAMGLQLAASMLGNPVSYSTAFRTCCIATASNVLPIPAGTIFHTSALISHGSKALSSGLVILMGNIMFLSLALVLTGSILSTIHLFSGMLIIAAGFLGLGISLIGLVRLASHTFIAAYIAVSSARIFFTAARIQLSFFALSVPISLLDAGVFTGAAALGAAAVILPSGLGISESLAALTATAVKHSSASAFIAIALNNLIALIFAGCMGFLLSLLRR